MGIELQSVLKPLRDLRGSLRDLSKDPAPEEVHKLRTRARHVEAIAAAAAAWEPNEKKELRQLLKSIKAVRKAAGAVRDMDVLTANVLGLVQNAPSGPLARLVEHLRSSRRAYANALHRVGDCKRKTVRRGLKEHSLRIERAFAHGKGGASRNDRSRNGRSGNGASRSGGSKNDESRDGTSGAARVVESEDAVRALVVKLERELGGGPGMNERTLHPFRLKAKKLRSILQLFAESDAGFVAALGKVNSRIGEWHDWQHLKEIAEKMPDAQQDPAMLRHIGRMVKNRLKLALTGCHTLRNTYLRTIPVRKKAA
jgi:CHAD domain-containing protein